MKIGLDVHGVCTEAPEFFSLISKLLKENNCEVHIITGKRVSDGAIDEIKALGISYTHFFSIADYHSENGTNMWDDENGTPWLDDETWNRTKGDYCSRNNIDFHIDDTERYREFFKTPFAFINIKK